MRLAELVAVVYAGFDADAAVADIVEVSRHDRYQASAGIAAAAAAVAERAQAAGLADVTVHTFPADAARRWWTYRAPLAWTPVRARLRCGGATLVRYPEQPYTLAAYSAPTPPGGRSARLLRWTAVLAGADPRAALVVLDDARVPVPAAAARLAADGATAIAADPLWTREDREGDQVGRLELPAGTRLAGFSLTPVQVAILTAAADAGGTAVVEVSVDRTGTMPVVTGLMPGTPGSGELLLTAHLCHPRPSANDNASGVAALLGAARVLAAGIPPTPGRDRPGVRFLWGPEFAGTAAYLHDVVHAGLGPSPVLAVNVDMAGEDSRCGGSMVVERGPDDVASFLPALATRCAALVPPAARSYSGAVPCDPWSWREVPFAGGSDHALLADEPTRCPALACGHWPDRANHSSADTLDAVDPAELRRTATVAASAVAAVRGRADPSLAADVAEATVGWAASHLLGALPGRQPPAARGPAGELLDPRDDVHAGRRLAHRAAVARDAVHTLGLAGVPRARVAVLAERIGALADAIGGWPPWAGDPSRRPSMATPWAGTEPALARPDQVLARRWPGPVNVRALAESAGRADREWLHDRLSEDRGGNYARTVALLRALDGVRDRHAAAWWAALASELPVPVAFADRIFDLLCRAGWAGEPTPRTEVTDAVAHTA